MTKPEFLALFGHEISPTAVVMSDGGETFQPEAHGKFSIVSVIDDMVDVWLCNTKDMVAGLTERKLTAMLAAMPGFKWHRLDGEAYCQDMSPEDVVANLKVLGIRKKRKMSEEQRAKLSTRLRSMR